MPKTQKQEIGAWGEEEATRFLSQAGYDIVERNYQIRGGEIDIIAWHSKYHFGKTLCFIEVKTRSYGLGSAERATGREKIVRLSRAAQYYCLERGIPIEATPIQFEQVSVYIDEQKNGHCRLFVIPME